MALKNKYKLLPENVLFKTKKPHVYRIENNINKRFYIGAHSGKYTNHYAGSSPVLALAYDKYGIENFTKTLIKEFNTFNEALEYEETIISDEMIKTAVCYNVKKGGVGGFASGENHPWFGKQHTEETKAKMRAKSKGRKFSEDFKKKISDAAKGRIFINKDGKNKRVYPDEFNTIYQSEGWIKGRVYPKDFVSPLKGKKANLTDAQRKNLSDKAKLRRASPETKAKMSKRRKNNRWINKDGVCKMIQLDTIDDYLKDGWKLGRK